MNNIDRVYLVIIIMVFAFMGNKAIIELKKIRLNAEIIKLELQIIKKEQKQNDSI